MNSSAFNECFKNDCFNTVETIFAAKFPKTGSTLGGSSTRVPGYLGTWVIEYAHPAMCLGRSVRPQGPIPTPSALIPTRVPGTCQYCAWVGIQESPGYHDFRVPPRYPGTPGVRVWGKLIPCPGRNSYPGYSGIRVPGITFTISGVHTGPRAAKKFLLVVPLYQGM
eukprot:3825549-Rhodomonas_salina.2